MSNSENTTHTVRDELVEGYVGDQKVRYEKLHFEYHSYLQNIKYAKRDKVSQMVILYACYMADILEGFYAISKYKAPLVQVPPLLLRSMYEVLVKLQYLADAAGTRDQIPSELLKRTDLLLHQDFKARKILDEDIKTTYPAGVEAPKAGFDYQDAIKNLSENSREKLSIKNIVTAIHKNKSNEEGVEIKAYITYRFLSKYAHPMVEGMGNFVDSSTGNVSVFNRTKDDMDMWYDCASEFTEGALQALKVLLTPFRTGVSENPSTSSGRTGVV